MPTETVYGLAADAANPGAVARIFEAKGRPRFNPLIVHAPDFAAARRLAVLDWRAVDLAHKHWPGPLTIVAPIADPDAVCDLARAGLDTVAVRVPAVSCMAAANLQERMSEIMRFPTIRPLPHRLVATFAVVSILAFTLTASALRAAEETKPAAKAAYTLQLTVIPSDGQ